MPFGWDDVVAYGRALDGVELSTSYRQPALKVNGHQIAGTGHHPDVSFVLVLPLDLVEMALTVQPDIFYQTPHYVGWPAVLARYSADFAEVTAWIDRARQQALAKKPNRRTPR